MITLEIKVIPDTKIDMQLCDNGKPIEEKKDLPLLRLRSGNKTFNVPNLTIEARGFINVEVQVERTDEPEYKIVKIKAIITKSVTQPRTYHPEITELFNGILQGEVSVKVI